MELTWRWLRATQRKLIRRPAMKLDTSNNIVFGFERKRVVPSGTLLGSIGRVIASFLAWPRCFGSSERVFLEFGQSQAVACFRSWKMRRRKL